MKKILVASLVSSMLAVGLMAGGNSILPKDAELTLNLGGGVDYIKGFGDTEDFGGVMLGAGLYKKYDKYALGMEFEAGLMDDYNNYAVELNGKYYVNPKLALVAGVGYSYYDLDGGESLDGVGVQAKVEYEVYNGLGVYAKYKWEDLNKGMDYSNKISTGVMYKF